MDIALPRLRRTAIRNLEMAYPEKTPSERKAIVDEVFHSIARLLYAFARFPRMNAANISQWIRYEGLEHYQEAKKAGRGVLFATAHLGNWELSAFAHGLMTEPMHVVIRPLDNPGVDRLVEERRKLSGNRLIEKWDSARAILRALRYPPVEISADPAEDTRRLQAVLEDVIREFPGQWLWIHRRWKTRPPGEPPLY